MNQKTSGRVAGRRDEWVGWKIHGQWIGESLKAVGQMGRWICGRVGRKMEE